MTEAIAAYYDDFGRRWAHGTSPLYEEWALGIARDERMLARIAPLDKRLRQANLLFAAARWAGCPLAPYREWSAWVTDHWKEVIGVASSRATQTNEPGRCATLLPVLSRIEGPVALLEVGAAAGLCLLPDRYSVVYQGPSGAVRLDPVAGPTAFALECRIDDEASVPNRMPEVVWRRGIDLRPIDPSDPDAIEWLATLIWPGPDHDTRVARLRGAAAVAASDPPPIERGDLLDRLADVAREAPRDATLVVYHSAVLLYLSQPDRERFADLVGNLGATIDRHVVWLSNETTGNFASFDAQLPPGTPTDHRFVQTVDGRVVALAGQHGATYETRGLGPT